VAGEVQGGISPSYREESEQGAMPLPGIFLNLWVVQNWSFFVQTILYPGKRGGWQFLCPPP